MKPKPLEEPLSSELESLFALEGTPFAAGEEMRQRALGRARAAMLAPVPVRLWTRPWFGAGGLTVVAALGALGAMTRPRGHALHGASMAPTAAATLSAPAQIPPGAPLLATPVIPSVPTPIPGEPSAPAARPGPNRTLNGGQTEDLEVTLLQPAQAALGRGDPAAALVAISEHERRFPNGQLAEEREALRVQALAAMGRKDDARRMAARFSERFPHSVLLARIDRGAP